MAIMKVREMRAVSEKELNEKLRDLRMEMIRTNAQRA